MPLEAELKENQDLKIYPLDNYLVKEKLLTPKEVPVFLRGFDENKELSAALLELTS